MKRTTLMLFAAALLIASCKDQPKENSTTETKKVEHTEQHSESAVIDNNWMNNIELNNGARWEANPETNEGVANMKSILTQSNPKELKDYHEIVNALNKEKNYVIKECSMKGPSHDNLHVWLLPLIEKIDALEEAKTLNEAIRIYKSIEQNVNAYDEYFE